MGKFENPTILRLLKAWKKVWALDYASALLGWDKAVFMPEAGVTARGEALSEIRALSRLFTLKLEPIVEKIDDKTLNEYERGVLRVLKREFHYYESIPEELLKRKAKATTKGYMAWVKAKRKADFGLFEERFREIVEIIKEVAERLGYEKHPYDALLDLYEEGLTVDKCERYFSIVPELSRIYKKVVGNEHPLAEERYEKDRMEALNRLIISELGFDFKRGRMDVSPHPFTESLDVNDVRITTWYHGKDFRRSMGAAVHEFGHALYELQIDPEIARTPIGGGVSLGVHESQSRFWENIVWRSKAFVNHFWKAMVAFLPFVGEYEKGEVYKYFTVVREVPIRVEADEVQYILHVYLRYIIERELLEDKLDVSEVPNRWNELFEKLFGYLPKNNAEGCLQDVHWSEGMIGYFPTYAIGTMLAAQIKETMEESVGDVYELVEVGQFERIREWLRGRIHRWGATFPPEELIERATGEPLNPEYFIKYLKAKYLGI